MDKIYVWEYNKKMFKFYVILQLLDTTFVDKGDEHLLFRPHMFVNDGDYGGLGNTKKVVKLVIYIYKIWKHEKYYLMIIMIIIHMMEHFLVMSQIHKLSPGNSMIIQN